MKDQIEKVMPTVIKYRRDFHKHPEAGWTEFRTAALAITRMKELGYTITMGKNAVEKSVMMGVPKEEELKKHQERAIAQGADKELVSAMDGGCTGFWADMKFTDDKIKFAFRTDMDANDMSETQDKSHRPVAENFSSVNPGAMHACGHDSHTAFALGLAEIVAANKEKLKGSVRFIFQPAEEGTRGADPMVAAGAVDGVDYILGLHVGFQAKNKGDLICGTSGFLATTKWNVNFSGVSAHAGGAPEEGKNALLAAAVASLNLHAISRHSDGVTRINVGKLIAGEGRNVIPPNALLVMETRGDTTELNEYMSTQAARVIKASAEMYDCTYSIDVVGGTKSGESSPEVITAIEKIAKTIPFFTNIIPEKNFGACDDYASLMSAVQAHGGKGAYIQVGVDKTAGHHNSYFDFNEEALTPAMELVVAYVFDILK